MSLPSPSQAGQNFGNFLSNNFSLQAGANRVGNALQSFGNFLSGYKKFVNAPTNPYGVAGYTPGAGALPAKTQPNTPLSVTGTPVTVPIINNANAPIVPNDLSNLKTTSSSIGAGLTAAQEAQKKAQATFDANQVAGKDVNGNPVTPTPPGGDTTTQPQTAFDKILALFKGGQDKINSLTPVPSVSDTTDQILAKFGYTPESFKQVADLNTQLTSINQQLTDLETQRQTEIGNLGANGGATVGTAGAEENRINRAYSVREAGLGAKASVITASISALTGAYDKAESAAKDYVTFATAQQNQIVSDIKYSMDFYKDVYTAMDTSDQKRINDLLDYQSKQLQLQQTAAQNEINNQLKVQGLDIQAMLADAKLGKLAPQPGQPVNPQTGQALPDLNETKNKDLSNANKLVLDAQKLIDLMKNDPSVVTRGLVPLIGSFQTDAGEFKAAYNAILHTYASEISTQLLRTQSNQDTIKSLLPRIGNSKEANIANLQGLIDKANGLMNGIDPTGGYRQNFGYNVGSSSSGGSGGAVSQVLYQGKKYNVDANGNMTLAQ